MAGSPDGAWLATGSDDGSARVFAATPGRLVQRALRVMDRPLNPAATRCPRTARLLQYRPLPVRPGLS